MEIMRNRVKGVAEEIQDQKNVGIEIPKLLDIMDEKWSMGGGV